MKQVSHVKSCAERPFHRCTMAGSAALSIAAAFLACATSLAGVKYWDNPGFRAYDVGDYVQDGLVVNYDGIRNAGPDAEHNPNAMTWVNSANPGTYDMMRYSTNGTAVITATGTANATKAWNNDAAHGSWTDNGFVFNKDACFHQPSSFAIPKTYTIQSLIDAKPGEQNGIGYIMCDYDAAHWAWCAYGMRSSNYNYGNGNVAQTFYLVSGSIGKRPAVRGASAIRFSYMTAIQNINDGVIFSETEAPWSATYSPDTSYGHAYDSSKTGTAYTYSTGFCLGGHYPRTDEMLKGTIYNFRFYDRCLSDAEVLWNRVIDESRYFGRGREITVIPVTNVVESFTIKGVRDYHYAIDGEGYTFTAPASKTVNGKRHVLSGYTLKTWNGSSWGDPVAHDGESSYAATNTTALVCITWQYTAAEDEGKLKTYDVGDYVKGAAIHFDGIRNAGESADHDPNAIIWKNLGSVDMDLVRIKYGYGDLGGWDGDGYWFTDTPKFTNYVGRANWPQTYTVQALLDANATGQQRTSELYVYSVSYNRMAMAIYPTRNDIQLHTQKESAVPYGPYLGGTMSGYVNGIVDAEAKTAAIFSGTEAPTSGNNIKSYETMDSAVGNAGIAIGGYGGNATYDLVGKIKSIRFYFNKVLTEEELEQNRKVDNYRFFGIVPVTNVLVQSTYSYLEGYDKCGPYEVDGSYTFVAPATVTAKGIDYACDGYTVETLTDGEWVVTTTGSGNSYLYSTSAGTVRLTWRWKSVKGLRSAADYAFDDLAPGAVLHYDGKLNAGVDSEHSMNATKWVNIGTAGSAYDAIWANVGSLDRGGWTDDGYESKGGGRFVTATSPTHHWSKSYTAQALVDADATDNTHESGNFIFAGGWDTAAMVIRGDCPATANRRKMWFHTQAAEFAQRPLAVVENGKFTYGTAILDGVSGNAVMFTGTKPPTSGTPATGYKHFDTVKSYNSRFFLGSWNSTSASNGADRYLYGTLKSIRYYDRVLTEEELERNRNVDSARYFGVLGVTNVWVETRFGDVAGEPEVLSPTSGAYKVEGSWTFTADQVKDENGDLVDVKGYYIRKFENGAWISLGWREGNSYTYDGSDGKTVRIIWRGPRPGMLFILR